MVEDPAICYQDEGSLLQTPVIQDLQPICGYFLLNARTDGCQPDQQKILIFAGIVTCPVQGAGFRNHMLTESKPDMTSCVPAVICFRQKQTKGYNMHACRCCKM